MSLEGVYRSAQIAQAIPVILIISILAAIVLTVLICVLVMPEKRRPELNKFFRWLQDLVQFRNLWIEAILKVLYIATTLILTIAGIIMLFTFSIFSLIGLILIIVGVFVNRIIYENILLQVLIFRNTQQINNKMGSAPVTRKDIRKPRVIENQPEPARPEPKRPEPEKEPDYRFCSQCGTKYDANKGGCPNGCE